MPARALLPRRRVAMLNQRIPSVHLQQTTRQISLPQARSGARPRRKTRLRAPLGSQLPQPARIPLPAAELPQRRQGTLSQLEVNKQVVAAERRQTRLQQRSPMRRRPRTPLAALRPSQPSLRRRLGTLTRLAAPSSILLRRATSARIWTGLWRLSRARPLRTARIALAFVPLTAHGRAFGSPTAHPTTTRTRSCPWTSMMTRQRRSGSNLSKRDSLPMG